MSTDAGFPCPPLFLTSPGNVVHITDLSLPEGHCPQMTVANQDLDVGVQSAVEPGLLMVAGGQVNPILIPPLIPTS